MTFSYLASFDFTDRRHGFGSVTFVRSGGATFTLNFLTDVVNGVTAEGVSCGIVNHYPTALTEVVDENREGSTGLRATHCNQSWASLFQQRMRQAAAGAGWSSFNSLTCAYNVDTMRYAFTYAGNFNTISFSTAATRRLFGFATDFSGSTTTVAGTLTPTFVLQPILSAVTMDNQDGYNYEPGGISQSAVADYGAVFSIVRTAAPLYRDWTQQSETRAKACRAHASSTLWTHQDLFVSCRSVYPFVVVNGFGDERDYVFKLRPEACAWNSRAVSRAGGEMDDSLFDVHYNTQLLGFFPDDDEDGDDVSGQLVINGFPVQDNESPMVING